MIKLILTCVILLCYSFKNSFLPDTVFVSTPKNDSAKAIKSITGFLQWYKINLHRVNAFPLLAKDRRGFYMIDRKACSRYLNFLHGNKFMSAQYIGYWQTFFDDKASLLKKQPVKDDIPEDFDMDFILMTQEPEIVLDKISMLKFNIVSMTGKMALIGVKLPPDSSVQYEFEMVNGKTGWQIAYISTANSD